MLFIGGRRTPVNDNTNSIKHRRSCSIEHRLAAVRRSSIKDRGVRGRGSLIRKFDIM